MFDLFGHLESIAGGFQMAELSLLHAVVPLRFTFKHAGHGRRVNETLLLLGRSANGHYCAGEALARPYVTGETTEMVEQAIRSELMQYGRDYLETPWRTFRDRTSDLLASPGGIGALCLLELCIVDGLLRDSPPAPPPASICRELPHVTLTIPFLPSFLRTAGALVTRTLGPASLKIKTSGKFSEDRKVLDAFTRGDHHDTRIDLNAALDYEPALGYLEAIAQHFPRLRWIEEPLAAGCREKLPLLHRHFGSRFVFCADESIVRRDDLTLLESLGSAGAVNLRVGKHGGIRETIAIADKARSMGLNLQVGSLVGETSLLTSAGILAAALTSHIRYLELGLSPRLLRWRPFGSWYRLTKSWHLEGGSGKICGIVPAFDADDIFRTAALVYRVPDTKKT